MMPFHRTEIPSWSSTGCIGVSRATVVCSNRLRGVHTQQPLGTLTTLGPTDSSRYVWGEGTAAILICLALQVVETMKPTDTPFFQELQQVRELFHGIAESRPLLCWDESGIFVALNQKRIARLFVSSRLDIDAVDEEGVGFTRDKLFAFDPMTQRKWTRRVCGVKEWAEVMRRECGVREVVWVEGWTHLGKQFHESFGIVAELNLVASGEVDGDEGEKEQENEKEKEKEEEVVGAEKTGVEVVPLITPGTYVWMELSPLTVKAFQQYFATKGIPSPVPAKKLHVSILTSSVDITSDYTIKVFKPLRVRPDSGRFSLEVWNAKNMLGQSRKVLVVVFENDFVRRRNAYGRRLGGVEAFNFTPHITISKFLPAGFEDSVGSIPPPRFEWEIMSECKKTSNKKKWKERKPHKVRQGNNY